MRIDIRPAFQKEGAEDWVLWYAWRPVEASGYLVWREYVYRRWQYEVGEGWFREYKLVEEIEQNGL